MRIFLTLALLFTTLFSGAAAQTTRKGNFLTFVDSLITAMPSGIGTNDYRSPLPSQQQMFGTAVDQCLKGDLAGAHTTASLFGYQTISFSDTIQLPNRLYHILLRSKDSSNHWGTFVFNPAARRSGLVIQSPHELFDTKTGGQGAFVFHEISARAFFLNGAHRCSNSGSSSCSGTTTACGASGPFKISDQAHTEIGTFQIGTITVLQHRSDAVVIQLHGFGKSAGDPDLIMGNGTVSKPTGKDHLTELKIALSSIDTSLTFKIAHIDTTWTELTGTTNTQGRLVNNSLNPCAVKPASANGRFLHLEQAYAGLRDTKVNWKKMSDALAAVFPADPLSVSGNVSVLPEQFLLLECYPNPFNPSTTLGFTVPAAAGKQVSGITTLKIYDALGREVSTLVNERLDAGIYHKRTFITSSLSSGIYYARLTSSGKETVRKMFLVK
ncbi:MAG: T9SS type A sorting domain-containing protein [Bacteroidetes bacterium]|nr:T9SS type A sorting domain-containing protein [Bacteroidota bacterium]